MKALKTPPRLFIKYLPFGMENELNQYEDSVCLSSFPLLLYHSQKLIVIQANCQRPLKSLYSSDESMN